MNPFPRPLVLGHRGFPLQAPENTLRSLGLAMQHGADGVEFDIQRSLDGVPVVIHDDSLERIWKVRRAVSRLEYGAIERLTAAQVPSFQQVASWAAASGAWLNVELKARDVERAVIRIVDETGLRERVILSSFDAEIVKSVGEADARIRRFFLTECWDSAAQRAFDYSGASGVCVGVEGADAATLDDLIGRRDLPVIVWTVNSPERVRELLTAGVAGVISDNPSMAARERALLFRA